MARESFRYVMGFMNYCSHDPAACLIKINDKGEFVDYIFSEEGFHSRRKRSYHFPLRSAKYCLDYFGIEFKQLDAICLDYMDKKKINRTSDNYRLLIGDYLRANLNISNKTEVFFCDSHHLAHAYSAFLASDFEESGVLVVDGLGSEQQTHSIYQANESGIKLINMQEGTGIGALYTLVTRHIGFESGEEGKTILNFSDLFQFSTFQNPLLARGNKEIAFPGFLALVKPL